MEYDPSGPDAPLSAPAAEMSSEFASKGRNSYDFQEETYETDGKPSERDEIDGKTDKEGTADILYQYRQAILPTWNKKSASSVNICAICGSL
jgi:hypothetical protein